MGCVVGLRCAKLEIIETEESLFFDIQYDYKKKVGEICVHENFCGTIKGYTTVNRTVYGGKVKCHSFKL